MSKLNIKESMMLASVNNIKDEVLLDKNLSEASNLNFFGDLEVPMQEIDAAMEKLQKMILQNNTLHIDNV